MFYPHRTFSALETDQLNSLNAVDVSPNTYLPSPDPCSVSLIRFEKFPPRGLSSVFSLESLRERRHLRLCKLNVNYCSVRKDLVNRDRLKSMNY